MAEEILSETPRRMQERVIWIDSEAGVGCAKALDRMVFVGQIKALRGGGSPSLFGDSGLAQAFENWPKLAQVRGIVAQRRPICVGAREGKSWVDRDTGRD
jgi:hypothetical protein